MRIALIIIFILIRFTAIGQSTFSIMGIVTDNKKVALTGASITIHEIQKSAISDNDGHFVFEQVPSGEYHLHISFLGYKCVHYNIVKVVDKNVSYEFVMEPDNTNLNEVVIEGNSEKKRKQQKTTAVEFIDNRFIEQSLNSNLIKSIERLPGISSIDIGQGFSKPVIRGLSFNRVAVTENGVKQEGQQWGADHGLEIDQFGIENIEIVKGPASLIYGSDAIGGVIQINPNRIPQKKTLEASFQTLFKSVNNLIGSSLMSKYRNNDWYYNLRFTQTEFSDYKVPADSFFYNRFRLPIHNKILKNTAGNEKNIYFSVGILKPQYKSTLTISNVHSKTGFFPGSHGIPSADKLLDDGNKRNIQLPYQSVNHLKIINSSKIYLPNGGIEFNVGYQNNFRQEWSLFHTHYPNQKAPEINPDLELEFRLNTLSSEVKYKYITKKNELEAGLSSQYQLNDVGGYIFLLSKYKRTTLGAFVFNKFIINKNFILTGGLRFDYGKTDISQFYSVYAQDYKSKDFVVNFRDFSWAFGFSYNLSGNLNIKAHVGKSFRMPNASELSANGIHHGSFRYEVGDNSITSEYSYQFDMGLNYSSEIFQIEISPFANYFPNFIFLSPTGSYLHPNGREIAEADAGQVYQYQQSESFRAGGEIMITYKPMANLSIITSAEYIYASDLNYPIPFTPPLNIYSEISYTVPKLFKVLNNTTFSINANFASPQNRVARNELKTPGYHIYNFSFSTDVLISKTNVNFALQIQNILNTKYFNHLSFYRIIELPESGRNVQLMLKIPFTKKF